MDRDIIAAWTAYRDASIAMDAAGVSDDSFEMQTLDARMRAAMEALARAVPTTPAGAAALLRFALDLTGEDAEGDAAREDRAPAEGEWTSDGHRVLYHAVRALEKMGRAEFDAALVALDHETAAAGFTAMIAAFEADAPAMIPAVPTLAMVEAGAIAAGATHEAIRAAYAAMAATYRGAA